MRIALNGTAFDGMASGARDRFLNLYGEAARLGLDHTFVMYSPREFDLAPLFPGPLEAHFRTPIRQQSTFRRFLASGRWFSRRLPKDGADLFVTDHFPVVGVPRYGTLLTIHDLRYLVLPGEGSFARRYYFRRRFAKDVGRAKAVVTVSQAIREEVTSRLGARPERVHVIPNGVGPEFLAVPAPRRSYLLSVGVLEARKNLEALLGMLAADPALPPLVLAGRGGPAEASLRAAAERLSVADRVEFRGYVAEEDLPSLYAGAAVFLLPSRYEGFGVPLLQAFAAGTPVVCSTAAALREVAGDAALLVDPDDRPGWGRAVSLVLGDAETRERLVAAGRARAERASWTDAAERFLSLVESFRSVSFEESAYPS